MRAERFTARHDGDSIGLVRRAWDVEGLGRAYARWLSRRRGPRLGGGRRSPTTRQAFATRSRLVHEWRKFLFLDPGLPRSLLPDDWPGEKAAEFFDSESERLRAGGDPLRRQLPDAGTLIGPHPTPEETRARRPAPRRPPTPSRP